MVCAREDPAVQSASPVNGASRMVPEVGLSSRGPWPPVRALCVVSPDIAPENGESVEEISLESGGLRARSLGICTLYNYPRHGVQYSQRGRGHGDRMEYKRYSSYIGRWRYAEGNGLRGYMAYKYNNLKGGEGDKPEGTVGYGTDGGKGVPEETESHKGRSEGVDGFESGSSPVCEKAYMGRGTRKNRKQETRGDRA